MSIQNLLFLLVLNFTFHYAFLSGIFCYYDSVSQKLAADQKRLLIELAIPEAHQSSASFPNARLTFLLFPGKVKIGDLPNDEQFADKHELMKAACADVEISEENRQSFLRLDNAVAELQVKEQLDDFVIESIYRWGPKSAENLQRFYSLAKSAEIRHSSTNTAEKQYALEKSGVLVSAKLKEIKQPLNTWNLEILQNEYILEEDPKKGIQKKMKFATLHTDGKSRKFLASNDDNQNRVGLEPNPIALYAAREAMKRAASEKEKREAVEMRRQKEMRAMALAGARAAWMKSQQRG